MIGVLLLLGGFVGFDLIGLRPLLVWVLCFRPGILLGSLCSLCVLLLGMIITCAGFRWSFLSCYCFGAFDFHDSGCTPLLFDWIVSFHIIVVFVCLLLVGIRMVFLCHQCSLCAFIVCEHRTIVVNWMYDPSPASILIFPFLWLLVEQLYHTCLHTNKIPSLISSASNPNSRSPPSALDVTSICNHITIVLEVDKVHHISCLENLAN